MGDKFDYQALLPAVMQIAKETGIAVLKIYDREQDLKISYKADKTPLTTADRLAHQLIKLELAKLTPHIPLLSEEDSDIPAIERMQWQDYWLVDPIDGTKEFIERTDEFTINIALIQQHQPVLGVIYAPVFDKMYYAARGDYAYLQTHQQTKTIQVRRVTSPLTIAISRRHGIDRAKNLLQHLADYQLIQCGSSLKSCMVAEGQADLYVSFGKTSEWDTAAAQCIVEAAGGVIVDLNMQPLRYNEKTSLLNPAFLVLGDDRYNWKQIIEYIRSKK